MRLVDPLIDRLLSELPAVQLIGPRATGKTTTALRHAASVARLDVPAQAAVFAADPDAALEGLGEPVLLDEWQEVPSVLGAVKRAVDRQPTAGRFLLTGSVHADLDVTTWPGTGRIVRVPLYGMAVRELRGGVHPAGLIDRLISGDSLRLSPDPPGMRAYVHLALQSGFPNAALALTAELRGSWLSGYVDQVLTRDASALAPGRDPVRLRRYLEAYALNTAGTAHEVTLMGAAGINRSTADAYEQLLTSLMIVDRIPAWTSHRLKRLALAPKRYVVDPALLVGILGVDAQTFMRDGDLLGRLLDTFVVAQLRAELAVSQHSPRLYHLREEHGRHEVDVVAELGGDRVLAFEVRATSAPVGDDARHLVWLRERLGPRFIKGVVLHTGSRAFPLGDRIDAVPICALWGG